MRVLMTADAVGGVWTYAMEVCKQLAKHDVCIVLATMGPRPSKLQRTQAEQIPKLQLHTADYKLEWMENPWADVERAGDWLLNIAARNGIDLVHLNGYVHAALPWRKPVVVVAHSCVYSWWQAVHGVPPPPHWERYRTMLQLGLNCAGAIVAPTQAFLEQLRQHHQTMRPSRVIHNARSPGLYSVDDCHSERAGKEPVVFACGRLWDEAKDMRVLDRAAEGLPWPVYVAGSDDSPDGTRFRATVLHSLGWRPPEQIAAWLKRSAVFVHPARYEPFGLSVLEAAHAGCALVLSDIPSLRELWYDAAVFVNPADAAALHAALRGLICDPARRRAFGTKARQRAMQFSPERMGEEYLSLYRALSNSMSARASAVA